MPEAATLVVIDRWLGRVSNRNKHADPQAPVEFENLQTILPGAVLVRGGMQPVAFDNAEGSASTYDISSATRFNLPHAEFVVYGNMNGEIHAGRGPSV